MKTPTIEEWKDEVQRRIHQFCGDSSYGTKPTIDYIESLIATQIKQAKKEERELMVKEIENQKKSNTIPKEMLNEYHKGYDQALNQLLETIWSD